MIKGILFDFGNVILNYTEKPFVEEVAKKYGVPHDAIQKVLNDYYSLGHAGEVDEPAHFFKLHQPEGPFKSEDVDWLISKMIESASLDPAVIALVRHLKEKGYRLGLLTNFTVNLHRFLKKFPEIPAAFDAIFHSHALKMKKPDPRFFQHALDDLGLKASETIFIDDLERHTIAAKKLGLTTITFKNAQQCEEELNRLLLKS